MSESPFIKFYPSDFLAGTSGLSAAERGVYITLICLIYEMDGPIERDDTRLARRCGVPKATFRKILSALIDEGKITESGGRISNRRAEKQLMDRRIRAQNGTHAARQRWDAQKEKTEQNQGPDDAGAMQAQCVSDASQKPEPDIGGGGGSARAHAREDDPPEQGYRERLLTACGADPVSGLVGPNGRQLGTEAQMIEARRWKSDLGLSEGQVIDAVTAIAANKRDGPPTSLTYFTRPLERLAGELRAAAERPMTPDNVHPLPAKGGHHARSEQRRREDAAIRETIRRIGEGTIDRGPDPSDPFAGG